MPPKLAALHPFGVDKIGIKFSTGADTIDQHPPLKFQSLVGVAKKDFDKINKSCNVHTFEIVLKK